MTKERICGECGKPFLAGQIGLGPELTRMTTLGGVSKRKRSYVPEGQYFHPTCFARADIRGRIEAHLAETSDDLDDIIGPITSGPVVSGRW